VIFYDDKNGIFSCTKMEMKKVYHHDLGEGDGRGSPLPFTPRNTIVGMSRN